LKGKNVFYDPEKETYLSETALFFIGGVLKHIDAITAITNPLINSYKRIVPGFEAPVYVSWAAINRSSLIRIPQSGEKGKRIEIRNPDPTSNPYLSLAVILKAGVDGIKNKILPPEPVNGINIFELSHEEKLRRGIRTLPSTLKDAIEALKKDTLILDVLGEHASKKYIEAKEKEWEEYRTSVTDWEIRNYLADY
ncbi:MAG: glutamine synthetase family protein, partial [Fervidobacterium sp.]